MFDAAAQLSNLYAALGDTVTPVVGEPFLGMLGAADVDVFDGTAQVGDYQLRYMVAEATLTVGSVLTVGSLQYRVVTDPQRLLDGREVVVRLVRHP